MASAAAEGDSSDVACRALHCSDRTCAERDSNVWSIYAFSETESICLDLSDGKRRRRRRFFGRGVPRVALLRSDLRGARQQCLVDLRILGNRIDLLRPERWQAPPPKAILRTWRAARCIAPIGPARSATAMSGRSTHSRKPNRSA